MFLRLIVDNLPLRRWCSQGQWLFLIVALTGSLLAESGGEGGWSQEVEGWLKELRSEEFQLRDEAQKNLQGWAEGLAQRDQALSDLIKRYSDEKDVEVKWRLREIIKRTVLPMIYKNEKGFLGINMRRNQGETGVLVQRVLDGMPAQKAGIKAGDLIVKAGGQELKDTEEISKIIQSKRPFEQLSFEIQRGPKILTINVTLAMYVVSDEGVRGLAVRRPVRYDWEMRKERDFSTWFSKHKRERQRQTSGGQASAPGQDAASVSEGDNAAPVPRTESEVPEVPENPGRPTPAEP